MSALLFAAAGAACILLGASAAAAQAGLNVPAQVFDDGRAGLTSNVKRPPVSRSDRVRRADPAPALMTPPESARSRTRAKVRFHWASQARDVARAAADEDDDFIDGALER